MDFTISVYGAHKLVPEEGRTVEKIMRAAAGLGFDGIDLGYYWGENTKAQEMKDAKTLAEDLQLKLTNYICGNNFGNAIAEDRLAAEIDKVKTALDEAAEFGCKNLRVFGGGYDLEWEKYYINNELRHSALFQFTQIPTEAFKCRGVISGTICNSIADFICRFLGNPQISDVRCDHFIFVIIVFRL